MNPLEIVDIRKSYGKTNALKGLSVTVGAGTIVGMIGPDGAGKTSAMRIACGLLLPDSGSVTVMGMSVITNSADIKQHIGYMPQRFSLYPDLTVQENLRFFADLYLVPRGEQRTKEQQLLQFSRLEPFRQRRAGALSGGMKQKLALACTLIHTPDLLILDEPTTGVDPVSRQEFWQILRSLANNGMAIWVSTPYMDEALLCDRVLLVDDGSVLAEGHPTKLPGLYNKRIVEIQTEKPSTVKRDIERLFKGVIRCNRFGEVLHIVFETADQLSALQRYFHENGITATEIEPGIEDLFVGLTGGERQ